MPLNFSSYEKATRYNRIIGFTLGNQYILTDYLGNGSLGAVYKADHTQTKNHFAVKILQHSLEIFSLGKFSLERNLKFIDWQQVDDDFYRQALEEVNLFTEFRHPNINPVSNAGAFQEDTSVIPFIVTEYAGGGSLKDLLSRGSLPPRRVLDLMYQICSGVDYIHKKNRLHLNLKPTNILLDENGIPKITDFGLSMFLESIETHRSPEHGSTINLYAPIERYSGQVGTGSDVFALALIFSEMLTGEYIQRPRPDKVVFNSNIPGGLMEVLHKATLPAHEERYQTAGELMKAIERAMPGQHQSIPGSRNLVGQIDLPPKISFQQPAEVKQPPLPQPVEERHSPSPKPVRMESSLLPQSAEIQPLNLSQPAEVKQPSSPQPVKERLTPSPKPVRMEPSLLPQSVERQPLNLSQPAEVKQPPLPQPAIVQTPHAAPPLPLNIPPSEAAAAPQKQMSQLPQAEAAGTFTLFKDIFIALKKNLLSPIAGVIWHTKIGRALLAFMVPLLLFYTAFLPSLFIITAEMLQPLWVFIVFIVLVYILLSAGKIIFKAKTTPPILKLQRDREIIQNQFVPASGHQDKTGLKQSRSRALLSITIGSVLCIVLSLAVLSVGVIQITGETAANIYHTPQSMSWWIFAGVLLTSAAALTIAFNVQDLIWYAGKPAVPNRVRQLSRHLQVLPRSVQLAGIILFSMLCILPNLIALLPGAITMKVISTPVGATAAPAVSEITTPTTEQPSGQARAQTKDPSSTAILTAVTATYPPKITPSPAVFVCLQAPLPRLKVGDTAATTTVMWLRSTPEKVNNNTVNKVAGGTRFKVIEGPACFEFSGRALVFWKVEAIDNPSVTGWVEEREPLLNYLVKVK